MQNGIAIIYLSFLQCKYYFLKLLSDRQDCIYVIQILDIQVFGSVYAPFGILYRVKTV